MIAQENVLLKIPKLLFYHFYPPLFFLTNGNFEHFNLKLLCRNFIPF
jgi:hypothetical protein